MASLVGHATDVAGGRHGPRRDPPPSATVSAAPNRRWSTGFDWLRPDSTLAHSVSQPSFRHVPPCSPISATGFLPFVGLIQPHSPLFTPVCRCSAVIPPHFCRWRPCSAGALPMFCRCSAASIANSAARVVGGRRRVGAPSTAHRARIRRIIAHIQGAPHVQHMQASRAMSPSWPTSRRTAKKTRIGGDGRTGARTGKRRASTWRRTPRAPSRPGHAPPAPEQPPGLKHEQQRPQ